MAATLSLMISPPFSVSSKPPLSLPSQHPQLLFRNQWPHQTPFKKPEPLAISTAAKKPLTASTGGGGGGGGGGSAQEEKWVHEGEITESLPNGMFWVRIDTNGELVLGHLSGRIRKSFIRVLPGDRVKIEVSRYDSSRGRITYRLRGGKDATT